MTHRPAYNQDKDVIVNICRSVCMNLCRFERVIGRCPEVDCDDLERYRFYVCVFLLEDKGRRLALC